MQGHSKMFIERRYSLQDAYVFFYIDIRQKTHTHLADGLELFIFFIVTSQQEAPIGACPFSFPQIGPNHTQVHCVSNSLQVVLLQLGEDNSKREIHSCINKSPQVLVIVKCLQFKNIYIIVYEPSQFLNAAWISWKPDSLKMSSRNSNSVRMKPF